MKKFLAFFILAFFMFSCTVPTNIDSSKVDNVSSVSVEPLMSHSDLVYGVYKGGSLIYNPDNTNLNHIIEGMFIPVRLEKLQVVFDSETQDYEYKDMEESINLGYLHINSVSIDSINFDYVIYNNAGNIISSGSKKLALSESLDLNKDGKSDIIYEKASGSRIGFENANYLTFITSEEDLYVSMYSLTTEYYPENRYPSGILGVSRSGKLVVELDSKNVRSITGEEKNSKSIVFDSSLKDSLVEGDFIIGDESVGISTVASVDTGRGETVVITDNSTTITASDIYEVVHLNLDDTLENITQKYGNEISRVRISTTQSLIPPDKTYSKTLIDEKGATLTASFKPVLKIKLSGYYDYNITSLKAGFGAYVILTNSIDLDFNLDVKDKFSTKYEKPLLAKPISLPPIVISGITIDIKVPITVGAEFGLTGKGTATLHYGNSLTVGGKVDAGAGVKWKSKKIGYKWVSKKISYPSGVYADISINPTFEYSQDFNYTVNLEGGAYGEVYLIISPTVVVEKIFSCINENKFSVKAGISGFASTYKENGKTKTYFNKRVILEKGYSNKLKGGIDFSVDLGIKEFSISKMATLNLPSVSDVMLNKVDLLKGQVDKFDEICDGINVPGIGKMIDLSDNLKKLSKNLKNINCLKNNISQINSIVDNLNKGVVSKEQITQLSNMLNTLEKEKSNLEKEFINRIDTKDELTDADFDLKDQVKDIDSAIDKLSDIKSEIELLYSFIAMRAYLDSLIDWATGFMNPFK